MCELNNCGISTVQYSQQLIQRHLSNVDSHPLKGMIGGLFAPVGLHTVEFLHPQTKNKKNFTF